MLMKRTISYTVTSEYENMRVLDFLRQKGFSRNILISMKEEPDAIVLNGCSAFGKTPLHAGDLLTAVVPETESSFWVRPVPIALSVLYEDEDLLIVNKPAGMPVHPSMGNYENTLANAAAWYFSQKGEAFVFRCVNRLDRDTTGALILAKNPLSAAVLGAYMKQRLIRRTYLAVTEGILPPKGTVDAPIARVPGSVILRQADWQNGEPAVTHFSRLDIKGGYSLAELHLETGRTHQIRVHMNSIGHPLPGDYLYHPVYDRIGRQALHSFQLEFPHPVTEKHLLVTAPVPEDFCRAFDPGLSFFRSHPARS